MWDVLCDLDTGEVIRNDETYPYMKTSHESHDNEFIQYVRFWMRC